VGVLAGAGQRQATVTQRALQIEVFAKFRYRERMHVARYGAAREQIDPPAPQLARALTRKHETQFSRLDEAMHFVEQFGHPLDFIHHHPVFVALRNPLAEPLRPGEQLRVDLMIEHVEEQRTGKLLVQPSGLTHVTRSEQKETLPRG
jgi:hypothetical protein